MACLVWCWVIVFVFCQVKKDSCGAEGGKILSIVDFGAIPNGKDLNVTVNNKIALINAFKAALPGDTVWVPPQTFYCLGGIVAYNLKSITLIIDGSLVAIPNIDKWPLLDKHYLHFFQIFESKDVSIKGRGYLDGQGLDWWNKVVFPEIYGPLAGERPKLLVISNSSSITVQDILLMDSPSWTLVFEDVANVEVSNITITVNRSQLEQNGGRHMRMDLLELLKQRRAAPPAPNPGLQPEDLNTDGIDVSGRDVWIHDSYIQNDDDSIAIKPCTKNCFHSDCSQNMLIENTVLTGFGASIGSVPPSAAVNCVKNITFRNIQMPYTGKGIYIKSNPTCDGTNRGIIADILYENITISYPRWWAIWIGPQQQHQPGTPLGDKCPLDYPIDPVCPTQGCVDFRNITLHNVFIDSPWLSPGVILGNETNPIVNLTFSNVIVKNPGYLPFLYEYKCEYTTGFYRNSFPVPSCLSPF